MTPVEVDGWDNRTYRLGDEMTVRLPTPPATRPRSRRRTLAAGPRAVAAGADPEPVAKGDPARAIPYPGRSAAGSTARRRARSASTTCRDSPGIAEFISRCSGRRHRRPARRGAQLLPGRRRRRTTTTRPVAALAALKGRVDTDRRREVWDAALATSWDRPPVWFHGDIAIGNLLVRDGRLAAVIDFGTSRRRRPGLRPGDRLDVVLRRQPREPSARRSARTRHLGPRPRLGAVEGPHHHRPSRRRTRPRRPQAPQLTTGRPDPRQAPADLP